MSPDFKTLINKIASGETLTRQEARSAFNYMMSGDATGAQIGAFLMGLRLRGETIDEITGAAEAMRAKAHFITAPDNAVDTCGTGGDGAHTYNISTAAAIVLAASGVSVAKHGNRAISSKSGSADVLEVLGINIDAPMEIVERSLAEIGIGFMMATRHHSAMRHVGPARTSLGTRTIFNLLGPLSNPAGVKRQLTGAYSRDWIKPMAETLGNLGTEMAWVVHGSDGLDEITTTGPTYVAQIKDGELSEFEITPEDAGLPLAKAEDLKGDTPQHNAQAMRAMLQGEAGAFRDCVVLNCAAALLIAGKAENLKDGAVQAAAALDAGKAVATLEQLISITNTNTESA